MQLGRRSWARTCLSRLGRTGPLSPHTPHQPRVRLRHLLRGVCEGPCSRSLLWSTVWTRSTVVLSELTRSCHTPEYAPRASKTFQSQAARTQRTPPNPYGGRSGDTRSPCCTDCLTVPWTQRAPSHFKEGKCADKQGPYLQENLPKSSGHREVAVL